MENKNKLQQELDLFIGVNEAAELWGYKNPGSVKNLCTQGKVICKKIGKTYIIHKNQPNPRKG